MKRKILSLFLSLSLIASMPASFSAEALEQKKSLDNIKVMEKLNKLSDGKLKINVDKDKVFITGELSKKVAPGKESALKFLETNKSLFGIKSAVGELKALSVEKDELGHTFVKFEQIIKGIKVDGGLLNVHFDENGVIVSVNGSLKENKTIEVLGSNKISESKAIEIAKKQYTFDELRETPKVEKMIINKDTKNYEVFKVNISYITPKIGNYDVFVEVASGKVIKTEDNIRYDGVATGSGTDVQGKTKSLNLYKSGTSYQMKDVSKSATDGIYTYDMEHGTDNGYLVSNSTNTFTTENHKASVSAHYYAGKVIDFYKKLFNRNSLDNQGMAIKSYTHFGSNYNNAFWTGYEMVYGDGDGQLFTYLSGDMDVVGHEMTHGVVEHTADLVYHNQPGAMNESMADVFGVLISTYDKYNVASGKAWTFNAADWVVGDDIYTPGTPGDALRSLADPNKYDQPDHMSEYQSLPDTEYGDWGGVHINSGIPNKVAYTIASKIGMERTARIYYRALSTYMTAYTDFADAKRCIVQAATDLYGANSSQVTVVNNAFDSVGVGQPPAESNDPYEPNNYFDVAYKINLGQKYESYITSESDVDFYKFNISKSGKIKANLSNLPGDYDLVLFDSNQEILQYSINMGTQSETIEYDATKSGDYYVVVLPYDGPSTTKKYSLVVNGPGEQVPVPTSVKAASSGYSSVKTSWNAVSGANGYQVYTATSSSGPYKWLNTVTGTSYNNTGLTTGKTYYYKVRSFKTVGSSRVYSNFSSVVSAKPIPSTPGSAKAASSGYSSVKTSWNSVSGASGYQIYTATSSSGPYKWLNTTTGTSYNNTGLTTGKTYYYKVRSFKTVGSSRVYSNFSSVVSAKPTLSVPGAVKSVSSGYNSVKTSWNSVSGASGYQIYTATSSSGPYKWLNTITGTSYNNTGLTPGKTYYYKVRSFKTVGSSRVYSNFSSVVSAKPTLSVPGTVKSASSGYNSVKTSWNSVSGASGYQIYTATSSSGPYKWLNTVTGTSYNNTGLTTGKTYYYKVRSFKTVGSSRVYSNFSSVVSAKPIPSTPGSVKAAKASSTSIKVTWGKVSGASGYEVYKSTSKTGSYSKVGTATGTSYTNSKLATGKTYYYKVRSYRTVGSNKIYSGWSTIVNTKL